MVRELVEVELPEGRTMWVSVEAADIPRDVGMAERIGELPGVADAARWVATELMAGLRAVKPDRVSAEFGLELALGNRGLVAAVCGVGGKAGIKVTMTWGADGPPDAEPSPATDPQ